QAPMEMNMTPMIDVSFLLIIFFICLPMKMLEGKIQAFLPTDKGINPTPTEPPLEIKVSVHIVARGEQPTMYPPPAPAGRADGIPRSTQNVPTIFRYKIGNDETANIREVFDYIKKAYAAVKDTPNAKITGEIKAGHKVPHKYVVAVLNKFAEAGLEKVDFYGTAIPPRNLRQAKFLPYPLKNYETAD
ncbi:MAG TPA: biopolymer transporter ExbD, partial [Planctomycetota bacterium]|nr:biopolymer transporter ExbD [Planctomycetota bacterium]